MTPEKLLVPFMDKGKQVSTNWLQIWYQNWKLRQREQPGTNGDWVCDWYEQHSQYCMWPPKGVCQKSCDHCACQKMVCTVGGVRVSKWKQWDQSGEGSQPKKRNWVEVVLDAESERSGTGGWKQEVSSTLVGIRELLREQNGYLKRIAQSLDGGLGAGEDEEDSTMRE